ncbi:MAG: hypothetical protein QOG60_2315 [Frankiaceae bacterium]|nr:hypothetical protein [Frankiaceae bacterium]
MRAEIVPDVDGAVPTAAHATLLDLAFDLTGLVDAAGRLRYVGTAVDLFGYTQDDLNSRSLLRCLHPDDRRSVSAAWRRLLDGERTAGFSCRLRRADGAYRTLEVRAVNLLGDPGVSGIALAARDLSDQQAAADLAAQVEERMRTLVDNSPVIVFALDTDGVITFARGRELTELGIDGDALVGRSIFSFGDNSRSTADAVARCLGGEDVDLVIDLRGRQFDLRYRPRWENGVVTGVFGVGTDISPTVAALEQVQASEARWRSMVTASADAAMVTDADGVVRFLSPAAPSVFGWNAEDAIGLSAYDFAHPDDVPELRAAFDAVLAEPDQQRTVEFRIRTPDGALRWAEVAMRNRLHDPLIRGMIGNLRDVSERHRARDALAESEARYRLIVETTQDGILLVDAAGRITWANQQAVDLGGRTREELLSHRGDDLVDARAAPLLEAARRRRQAGTGSTWEMPYTRPDGEERHLLIKTTPLQLSSTEPDAPPGLLVLVSDVTQRKRAEGELARLALHDGLTGLPNRGLLLDRVAGALTRRRRHGGLISLLVLDVDQFHSVNDSVGTAGADDLLLQYTQRLNQTVRAGDTVARLGSDEFAVLSEELEGDADAALLADRLLTALAQPMVLPGPTGPVDVVVTASIGVALTRADALRPDDLLQRAELAMHRAKARGRACYETVSDAGEQIGVDRLRVVNDLRAGLRRGELELHYQPVVELASGRVVGAEALVRWHHPERGLLGPDSFIALAEASGLIRELGAWVLRTACRQAMDPAFRAVGGPGEQVVAVNLSTQQLADPRLVELVSSVLAETGMAPHRLMLEVTETALFADTTAALTELQSLRRLGVRLALDDFGTGFSSLTYLKRFPLHELKIDQSFVAELMEDPASDAIVASVVSLARAIGLAVVAEGIETEAQRRWLIDIGCTLGQGFLFGRPVPADRFAELYGPTGGTHRLTS